jgi:hypothetical protein
MRAILSSFELDAQRRTLVQELAGQDDRQLLDIGLVRGADGSLRLAADPWQPVGSDLPRRRLKAFFGALAGFSRWLRSLPLRSPDWRPHFFLRE